MATVAKVDPKAPFSLATTPRCRVGCNSFPWITPFYLWSVPYSTECKAASSIIFESLVWLHLGLNPCSPGHWWTLYPLVIYIYIILNVSMNALNKYKYYSSEKMRKSAFLKLENQCYRQFRFFINILRKKISLKWDSTGVVIQPTCPLLFIYFSFHFSIFYMHISLLPYLKFRSSQAKVLRLTFISLSFILITSQHFRHPKSAPFLLQTVTTNTKIKCEMK